jgi:CDP-diacylglycerol---glycerol-3-phosphate 3-phosphatidyltransferase
VTRAGELHDATPSEPAGSSDDTATHRLRPVAANLPPLPPPKPDPMAVPANQVSAWNVANYLTVLRIALVPVLGVFLWHGDGHSDGWRIAAFVVFALAALTDRLDGDLARKRNLVTDFGKLMDPIADKALMGTALVGLSSLGLLWWWVTVVILAREFGITALRLWVLRHGVLPASRGGKLKTFLQSVAIGLLVLPLPYSGRIVADVVMAAALLLTVVTGVDYVVKALRLRRTPAAADA